MCLCRNIWVYTALVAVAGIGIDGVTLGGFSHSYGVEISAFEIHIFSVLAYSAGQSTQYAGNTNGPFGVCDDHICRVQGAFNLV